MKAEIRYIGLAVCLVLGTGYYAFYLSNMFVSTAKFAVRGGRTAISGDILTLLSGLGSASTKESYVVAEYIKSLDMLKEMDSKLGLRSHYSQSSIDFISRLDPVATYEEFLNYWESVARVSYDNATGILTVEVRAYTPKMAHDVVFEIIKGSEELMNRMNDRVQEDTVHLAKKEMMLAETRYTNAKMALNRLRSTNSDLDPKASAKTRFAIIADLEGKISNLMVQIQTRQQFMKKGSVQMRILQGNLAELQDQLLLEKRNLTGGNGPEMLRILDEYESLSIENEFARNYYIATLKALETARVQSESKTIYLEAFQNPTLPEKATYPDRVLSVLLVIVVVGMGYSLLLLVVAAVKEHIGV